MTTSTICLILALVTTNVVFVPSASAQDKSQKSSKTFIADYPDGQDGILIDDGDWLALSPEFPQRNRVKHGVAAAVTYGSIPAIAVSEYAGLHSATEIHSAKPFICLCHVFALPGNPVLVKLHSEPKLGIRVLDGGRLPVIGAEVIQAKKSDVIPIDLQQPDKGIWLLRPTEELPAGEYALMLGAQNLSIFTFSVAKQRVNKASFSK